VSVNIRARHESGAGELLTLAGHIYLPALMKDP